VRKHKDTFIPKRDKRDPRAGQLPTRPVPGIPAKPSAVGSKRVDPIIMLSPSASSLLRMSNIKSFLDNGVFVPFDHSELASFSAANLLHLTRPLKRLGERPFRFILVDSPEQFKPEYWNRVVAVFTTGQTWQFRGYKWREPQSLFENVLGIYVGEKGQPVPSEVKSWGSNVKTFAVDRWDERAHGKDVLPETRASRRWKDRETVEEIWRAIENWMNGRADWKRS
jgi:parafibromin